MVRFKDVTKVVLVLALYFGFAGVGNCNKYREESYNASRVAYKEAKNAYINAEANYQQGVYINGLHEKCKKIRNVSIVHQNMKLINETLPPIVQERTNIRKF